jgi:hypothetical protein
MFFTSYSLINPFNDKQFSHVAVSNLSDFDIIYFFFMFNTLLNQTKNLQNQN